MRWRINGADKDSGAVREIWIEALSHEEAIEVAADMQILVSSALKDPPVSISQSINVKLDRRQAKKLGVTEMRIASGVFVGISVFCIFWGLIGLATFIWVLDRSIS